MKKKYAKKLEKKLKNVLPDRVKVETHSRPKIEGVGRTLDVWVRQKSVFTKEIFEQVMKVVDERKVKRWHFWGSDEEKEYPQVLILGR